MLIYLEPLSCPSKYPNYRFAFWKLHSGRYSVLLLPLWGDWKLLWCHGELQMWYPHRTLRMYLWKGILRQRTTAWMYRLVTFLLLYLYQAWLWARLFPALYLCINRLNGFTEFITRSKDVCNRPSPNLNILASQMAHRSLFLYSQACNFQA